MTPATEVALNEALAVLLWDTRVERTCFANLALEVVCAAVVRAGRVPMPLAVNLRFETPEETQARLVCLRMEQLFAKGAGLPESDAP